MRLFVCACCFGFSALRGVKALVSVWKLVISKGRRRVQGRKMSRDAWVVVGKLARSHRFEQSIGGKVQPRLAAVHLLSEFGNVVQASGTLRSGDFLRHRRGQRKQTPVDGKAS